jgi:hypothetical protein
MLKVFYKSTLILAYINHTIVTTGTTGVYTRILALIKMLHAAYVCKIFLRDDG